MLLWFYWLLRLYYCVLFVRCYIALCFVIVIMICNVEFVNKKKKTFMNGRHSNILPPGGDINLAFFHPKKKKEKGGGPTGFKQQRRRLTITGQEQALWSVRNHEST